MVSQITSRVPTGADCVQVPLLCIISRMHYARGSQYMVRDRISLLFRCTDSREDLLPSHYQYVHQSGVRAISWIRAPSTSSSGEFCTDSDPTVIASGGHDGTECLWDIRDPSGNVMNRTRGIVSSLQTEYCILKVKIDVIPAMPWSPYAGGPVTIDHENAVKAYSISPSMMGRGHLLLEPAGPVWASRISIVEYLTAHTRPVRIGI